MIFGMPTISFLVFLSWPVTFIVAAIIVYFIMAKQDVKEEEFEIAYEKYMKQQQMKTQGGNSQ